MRRWLTACSIAALFLLPALAIARPAWHRENPNVLWHFVHDLCQPKGERNIYPPTPCIEVDHADNPARGHVVFKDRDGRHQYLVLPLARITGIEDPLLLKAATPNYLAAAWTARLYVEAALHRRVPRDVISLVVNSAYGRTQDQLHVHVDCIRADVHAQLQRMMPDIKPHWHMLPEPLPRQGGQPYMARWLSGATFTTSPFRLLARALPPNDRMARHSLVVVGAWDARGRPGFILLSARADTALGRVGNSDNLQDRRCTLATGRKAEDLSP